MRDRGDLPTMTTLVALAKATRSTIHITFTPEASSGKA